MLFQDFDRKVYVLIRMNVAIMNLLTVVAFGYHFKYPDPIHSGWKSLLFPL